MSTINPKQENALENGIKAFMEYYGIPNIESQKKYPHFVEVIYPDRPSEIHIEAKKIRLSEMIFHAITMRDIDETQFQKYHKLEELAKLIKFIRDCKGRAITFGTIGSKKEVTLRNQELMRFLDICVCSWLDWEEGGLFKCTFGWDYKKPIYNDVQEKRNGMEHIAFVEPYTDEEIDQIIEEHCYMQEKIEISTRNGRLGYIAHNIMEELAPVKEHFETQTKLYSFIHDVMLVCGYTGKDPIKGHGYSGDIGREKYIETSHWLKAYETHRKKQCEKKDNDDFFDSLFPTKIE